MASWAMVCLLELEVTKAEFRIRILKKKQTTQWPKEKVQKDKQQIHHNGRNQIYTLEGTLPQIIHLISDILFIQLLSECLKKV
jgi:hypothetical protein